MKKLLLLLALLFATPAQAQNNSFLATNGEFLSPFGFLNTWTAQQIFNGGVVAGGVQFAGVFGADSNILMNQWQGGGQYNAFIINGVNTATGMMGMIGGKQSPVDNNLYFNVPLATSTFNFLFGPASTGIQFNQNGIVIGNSSVGSGFLTLQGGTSGNRSIQVNNTGTTFTFGGGPLAVAEGGTGDTGTAWAAFTPSFSCGTATFTNNSSRFKTLGKTTWIQFDFTITAIGTCTNQVNFLLPNSMQSTFMISGQDTAVTGVMMGCKETGTTTAACVKNAIANFLVNEHFIASGVYENQ